MRKSFLLAVPALLFVTPTRVFAQPTIGCQRPTILTAPIVFVSVNGQCVDLSGLVTPIVGGPGWNLLTTVNIAGARIDLSAVFDPDPSVTFTETTLNPFPATSTYSFLFGLPIVPDFYSSASSATQVTATAVVGTTTIANSAVYPTFLSGYGLRDGVGANLGVDVGTTPCVASGAAATTTCDEGTAMSTFGPTFYNELEALLTYTQNNALSTATFSGNVTINRFEQVIVTPEPGSLGLLAIGFLVVAVLSPRTRRYPKEGGTSLRTSARG